MQAATSWGQFRDTLYDPHSPIPSPLALLLCLSLSVCGQLNVKHLAKNLHSANFQNVAISIGHFPFDIVVVSIALVVVVVVVGLVRFYFAFGKNIALICI